MVSTTRAAESTDVVKKMTTCMIATTETAVVSGKFSRKTNNAPGMWPSSTTGPIKLPGSLRSMSKDANPKTPNQMTREVTGTASTPRRNSRIKQPWKMRAMKMPTNGHQVTVQAQ